MVIVIFSSVFTTENKMIRHCSVTIIHVQSQIDMTYDHEWHCMTYTICMTRTGCKTMVYGSYNGELHEWHCMTCTT